MRYARLRPDRHRSWPECYHRKLYPVLEQQDPTVRTAPGYIWIETPWKAEQSVWAADFEILELGGASGAGLRG